MTTHIDTVVIGAGAAGLTVGKRLSERGIAFVILDDHARVGDSWRERYRSLQLFTPRSLAERRGMRLGIGFFAYPTGDQYADYLERYARRFALPVRLSTRVASLSLTAGGRFHIAVAQGEDLIASRVIVTAGAHRVPVMPSFASAVAPDIRQLHSLSYVGPEQLGEGTVLVVGAANTGTDIALEAAAAGHAVIIAGRHPGQVPADIDNPIGNLLARIFIRRLARTTIDTEKGRAMRDGGREHGVNLVRNKLNDLDRAGIARVGPISGVDAAGRPVAAGHGSIDAGTVVWCTGSRPHLTWIAIDDVVDASGWPAEHRGMSLTVPGLAFVGFPFQYSAASPTLMGMDADARYVVDRLYAPDRTASDVTAAIAS